VLVVLALVAAACSSAPTVGTVGSTLPAMGGTVTLARVISPVYVQPDSKGPSFGHKLVAVILTVAAPAGSAAPFGSIYKDSKLVDSAKLGHVGLSTTKFHVAQCALYLPFTTVAAGHTQTGCDVFQLATAAIPVELKITGKAKAEWRITPAQISLGVPPAPVALPHRAPAPAPNPLAALNKLGIPPAPTETTAVPGARSTGGSPTGKTAPATGSVAPGRHHGHHGASGKASVFGKFSPNGGATGAKVAISGRRLTAVTKVTFDGVPALVQKIGSGKIVAVVPVGARTGPIVLITPSGTLTSSRAFVVL
jgi:hypothetical protein